MKKLNVMYLPIGVPTFHLESAQKLFDESIELLKSLYEDVTVPQEMLLSIDKVKAFLEDQHPDLIIVQNITFANSAYLTEIIKFTHAYLLLWTLKDQV